SFIARRYFGLGGSNPEPKSLRRRIEPHCDTVRVGFATPCIGRNVFIQPRTRQVKLPSGFMHCIDDNTMITLTGHSRVNIDRGLSPIELKQDCATPIDSNFAERLSIEQILAHDAKGLLNLGAVELLVFRHFYSVF